MKLLGEGYTERVAFMLSKKANIDVKHKEEVQRKIIDQLIKKNAQANSKTCETLISKFGLQIEDFEELVAIRKNNSVHYFANLYLMKKDDDKEYIGLNRVEELFVGLNDCLAFLVTMLY